MNGSILHTVSQFCYIFPKLGMDDLKLRFNEGSTMCFAQDRADHVPHPRIGFYQLDRERYRVNLETYTQTMSRRMCVVPAPLSLVQAFVSVANGNRSTY